MFLTEKHQNPWEFQSRNWESVIKISAPLFLSGYSEWEEIFLFLYHNQRNNFFKVKIYFSKKGNLASWILKKTFFKEMNPNKFTFVCLNRMKFWVFIHEIENFVSIKRFNPLFNWNSLWIGFVGMQNWKLKRRDHSSQQKIETSVLNAEKRF